MQFLKQLRSISLRKNLPAIIILFIISAAIFIGFGCQNLFKLLSPKTLSELTPENMEGAYVEDDIYYFYTPYLQEEKYKNNHPTGKITSIQFIVDFDETYYMGLSVHGDDLDGAEDMMEACDDYYYGEITAEEVPVYHVKGTIRAMDREVSDYYYDAASDSPDTQEVMLPYYLDVNRIGSNSFIEVWIWTAISLILLLISLFMFIKALTGGYQKKLKTKLESMGSLDAMTGRLERFYDSTAPVCGVRMDSNFIFFQHGAESIMLLPRDLAWAYQSTTQHRTYGIPTGKSHAVTFRTMDGRSYGLSMKENQIHTLLDAIHQNYPAVVIGYNVELEQLYKNNRNAFAARWEKQLSEYPENNQF